MLYINSRFSSSVGFSWTSAGTVCKLSLCAHRHLRSPSIKPVAVTLAVDGERHLDAMGVNRNHEALHLFLSEDQPRVVGVPVDFARRDLSELYQGILLSCPSLACREYQFFHSIFILPV